MKRELGAVHKGTSGGHRLHDIWNHNDLGLIDFACSRNLIIKSIYFSQKRIDKRIDDLTFIFSSRGDSPAASLMLDYKEKLTDCDH